MTAYHDEDENELASRSVPEAGKAVDADEIRKRLQWIADARWDDAADLDSICTYADQALAIIANAPAAIASVPAPSGAEPMSLRDQLALEHHGIEPPQAVPAEDVAGLRQMSDAHREHAQSAVEHCASLNRLLSIAEAKLTASEAEATSLRRKLEEAERYNAELISLRKQDDAELLEAERKLEEYRKALEPFGRENDLPSNLPDSTRLNITFAGQQVAHATFGDFRRARILSGASE